MPQCCLFLPWAPAFRQAIARMTRGSLLQVVREDYIRTARSKGLQERAVVIRHALKNSMIPVVTILGPMFAACSPALL